MITAIEATIRISARRGFSVGDEVTFPCDARDINSQRLMGVLYAPYVNGSWFVRGYNGIRYVVRLDELKRTNEQW